MPGSCYLCDVGYQRIPGAATGDSLGTCKSCSVLACSAHAVRDANYPRWVCVICDANSLTASAIAVSGGPSLGNTLSVLVSSGMLTEDRTFDSLESFLIAQPQMAWVRNQLGIVLDEAPRRFTTNATEPFWFGLTDEGRRLIAAAIAIVERLRLPPTEMVEALRILIETWHRRG